MRRSKNDRAFDTNNAERNVSLAGFQDLWDSKRDTNDYPDEAFNPGAETLTFAITVAQVKANIKNNESSIL